MMLVAWLLAVVMFDAVSTGRLFAVPTDRVARPIYGYCADEEPVVIPADSDDVAPPERNGSSFDPVNCDQYAAAVAWFVENCHVEEPSVFPTAPAVMRQVPDPEPEVLVEASDTAC